MQPGMAGRLEAMGEQRVVRIMAVAAGKAASGWRAHEVAVQPFDYAAGEGEALGLGDEHYGGWAYILSGSLRRSGQRVRISMQLVEAKMATSLWAVYPRA